MHFQKLLPLVLLSALAAATGCQLVIAPFQAAAKKSQTNNPAVSKLVPTSRPQSFSKEYEATLQEASAKFNKDDFSWLDYEARRLREKKERLPGGFFKLRAFYKALEEPQQADGASNREWEEHIARLESWAKQNSQSVTARVALAHAWKNYGWRARGDGYANTLNEDASAVFHERLVKAAKVLEEASHLDERCPEWYHAALWVGIGQSWEPVAFDRIFRAGVELEPTYYYLYSAKATYLLPRWYGEEGDSERFAKESASKVGGQQGDIIFFAVYEQLRSLHGLTFVNTHKDAVPRILDGFRAIEKLYGATPDRLNVACYFAIASNDRQYAADLFNRIGEDYDPEVWRTKRTYEMFRQGALSMAKAAKDKQGAAQSSAKTN